VCARPALFDLERRGGTHAELDELMALAEEQKVRLETKAYPLSQINDALEALNQGNLRALTPG
jgi:D-arabinose 1-dehydrogenase-like Zn-dependent alcohol dehydrogenase